MFPGLQSNWVPSITCGWAGFARSLSTALLRSWLFKNFAQLIDAQDHCEECTHTVTELRVWEETLRMSA
jgi:hypothetical protein